MKIAVASPTIPQSLKDGLFWLEKFSAEAALMQAEIICFPESYLPGYPGIPCPAEDREKYRLKEALDVACKIASTQKIAIILLMDGHWKTQFILPVLITLQNLQNLPVPFLPPTENVW